MILITGANGFVGNALVHQMVGIFGVDQVLAYTSRPLDGIQCILHRGYCTESFDFLGSGYGDIQTIIHVGAATPKSNSEANKKEVFDKNVETTTNLVNARLPKLKKFIFISTLDVYGQSELICESSTLNPSSEYGVSKLKCEKIVHEHFRSTGIISQVLRLGHVYGPGEEQYKKLIPEVMRKILQNEPLQIWGTGNELRAFIYIQDVVNCILAAFYLDKSIDAVNIAGAQQIRVKDLIDLILTISGSDTKVSISGEPGRDVIFDCTMRQELLLANEMPLQEGLLREWQYMKNLQW